MKYSICMTNYNTEDILEKSLDSIISRINSHEFEIIVVDSKSKDKSLHILNNYASKYGNMKIISKKCLRGMGRQIAFKNSVGNIIITADCDTVYDDNWMKIIRIYEQNDFDFALCSYGIGIYPRELLDKVDGWNNLQYWEDVELWSRLAEIGKYKNYPVYCCNNYKRSVSVSFLEKTYRRYRRMHDKLLLAKQVPFYLYFLTYYSIYIQKKGSFKHFFYQSAILIIAKIISYFRSKIFKYGDIKFLNDINSTIIDLNIENIEFLEICKYDTKEKCIQAYKNGDFGYLP